MVLTIWLAGQRESLADFIVNIFEDAMKTETIGA